MEAGGEQPHEGRSEELRGLIARNLQFGAYVAGRAIVVDDSLIALGQRNRQWRRTKRALIQMGTKLERNAVVLFRPMKNIEL